jgi:superfamily II DNA or RNA helicase
MKIYVSCQITIREPTRIVYEWIKENLTLENPQFYKLEKMGKYTGNTPQEIKLYQAVNNGVKIPFGCIADLWKLHPVFADWVININPIQKINYNSKINLYDYQERAVQAAVRKKNGILIMPCGGGKTQSGLEIIARVGGKALWLTHTQDLLNQSKKRAESVLQIDGSFGTITEGKADIGTHITFATVQTLSRMDLSQYRNEFDVIVVDECQHAAAGAETVTQFYKVLSGLTARYKIGLTATPKRADGLEKSMFAILGDVIHEVSREEVKHTTCPIVVKPIYTHFAVDFDEITDDDGNMNYNQLVEMVITDTKRMKFVADKLNEYVGNGAMIVLANRVKYLQGLARMINSDKVVCLSGMGQSKKAKEERKQILEKLNNNELDCVFATYQLLKEGIDVPNLHYIALATPEKDETTVIQSVGRVGRKADGKECGTVLDFVDDFAMYYSWFMKRQGYYRKINAKVY